MTPFSVVLITAPKGAPARKVAHAILKRRLAACVNIVDAIESHYWWKGKIERGNEALLVVKTRKSLFRALVAEVTRVHPYDVPEIVMLDLVEGNRPYLTWLRDETKEP